MAARIDRADPDRKPAPRPDIRSMLRPLGPVVVFGASNFPSGFFRRRRGYRFGARLWKSRHRKSACGASRYQRTRGADGSRKLFASAACRKAFSRCCLAAALQIGTALMKHPLVKAGGFTGSRAAGRILMDVAAARPEPIPFYAEMSSTNPVFILPGALRERGENIAAGLHTSFTMGAGQFCTKPGMVFLPHGDEAASFTDKLRQLVAASTPFHLLTRTIHSSYDSALAERKADTAVTLVAEAPQADRLAGFAVNSALFETDANCVSRLEIWTRRSLVPQRFSCVTRAATNFLRSPALSKAISPPRFTAPGRICMTSPISSRFLRTRSDGSSLTDFRPESKSATPWFTEARIPRPQTAAPRRWGLGQFSGLPGPSAIKDFPTKRCRKN